MSALQTEDGEENMEVDEAHIEKYEKHAEKDE